MRPLRWGVIGVSEMVGRRAVLPALRASETAELMAIASRDGERARREAAAFAAPRSYGDYASLLADRDIEAVYIPLPNALHSEWSRRAITAGKHVLCEKPLACSAPEAAEMAAAAETAGVQLMEACMTPFHPRYRRALAIAASQELGALRSLRTVFSFPNRDPLNHRWSPAMGGGALLDVGVYCLEPLLQLGGEPRGVSASQVVTASGVDATFQGWLQFEGGLAASFLASFEAPERQLLEITGTQAGLAMDVAFTAGADDRQIEISYRDGRRSVVDGGGVDPYRAMVEHFAALVRGEAAPLRPPAASLRTLTVIDRLRAAIR